MHKPNLSKCLCKERRTTPLCQPVDWYPEPPIGLGDATGQGLNTIRNVVQREAYVLAYIDSFWLIAWVLVATLLLVALLARPRPNPLTPPRIRPAE